MKPSVKANLAAFQHDARLYLTLGIANWSIFIDHIPNNVANLLTLRNFGFSGAADLFVFVVGYGVAIIHAKMAVERGYVVAVTRIFRRVWRLYAAYVVLFVIYIDAIAYVASQSMAPEIIHEYNISGILEHPLRILVRGLVLQEEPLNLDLLQLMIPLMAFFPLALWGLLRRPNLMLAASVALYVAARWFDWSFRLYPDQEWTFNPFCWQMLMVLGGWFAVTGAPSRALHGMAWLRVLAGAYLLFAMAVMLMRHSPALAAYLPDVLLNGITLTDRENLAPYRVVHFLALAFLAAHLVRADHPALQWKSLQPVIRCGEEWLAVFCVGVFLSFAGHLVLITGPNLVVMQIVVSLAGFAAMTAVAYYISWSKRQDLPAALRQRA
ncbi:MULTISPECIES: OpgC domain-containing protein [unclassified Bradyrhizobium]|uniref:OpgC domain-containing protein n=1 Tax=unclassified Bradyrhizobium TaxID=2631580 RepID=UPI00247A66FC|nr:MULTISPECIES: OpgC domain-containing protein [unclassified Bradyrhizobium]WGR72326.1 OpgC domain-containing protein [Bradyrhizobium sp. ISRA426]WGR77160.1 OpgC domain-containing protein [Bradyrhizobium sp. ISRA430]WGR87565.1 OpgC domain-containing protein [Bradyrhizobium sp. ISRA432]